MWVWNVESKAENFSGNVNLIKVLVNYQVIAWLIRLVPNDKATTFFFYFMKRKNVNGCHSVAISFLNCCYAIARVRWGVTY